MASSEIAEAPHYPYIVVGGGIAGVTCAETLSSLLPEENILLLTASALIKAVTNFRKVTKTLEEFDVEEHPMYKLNDSCPNVTVVHNYVSDMDTDNKVLRCSDGTSYHYDRVCLCTGGTPKVIAKNNPHVIGIRDTETVKEFQKRLQNARRVLIVGNGGIATELCYEIEGCEVVWAIKDKSITHTFVDAGAAEFFLPELRSEKTPQKPVTKRTKYRIEDDVCSQSSEGGVPGSALGPDWSAGLAMKGAQKESHRVHVEYLVEVKRLLSPQQLATESIVPEQFPPAEKEESCQISSQSWPVYAELTNEKVYGCDFVVSATGVVPATTAFESNKKLQLSDDGAVCVNDKMESSVGDVYAAGDVCQADWKHSDMWVQMRLWSQARQTGHYAAKCMVAAAKEDPIEMDFCFELFAHITKFFNYKVVLLGKYNAQGLGSNYELLVRVTKGVEYVKVVMSGGRMMGAVLIGETDLEETFENLILNQMDLTRFGEDLLDPNIDIEDFFD